MPGEESIYFLEAILLGVKGSSDRKASSPLDRSRCDRAEGFEKTETYRHLNDRILSLPEVRTDRVAAFRRRIEAGGYHPEGEAIIEKVIQAALLDRLF